MRHVVASESAAQGARQELAQEFLGRSSEEIARYYPHFSDEQKRDAIQQIAKKIPATKASSRKRSAD